MSIKRKISKPNTEPKNERFSTAPLNAVREPVPEAPEDPAALEVPDVLAVPDTLAVPLGDLVTVIDPEVAGTTARPVNECVPGGNRRTVGEQTLTCGHVEMVMVVADGHVMTQLITVLTQVGQPGIISIEGEGVFGSGVGVLGVFGSGVGVLGVFGSGVGVLGVFGSGSQTVIGSQTAGQTREVGHGLQMVRHVGFWEQVGSVHDGFKSVRFASVWRTTGMHRSKLIETGLVSLARSTGSSVVVGISEFTTTSVLATLSVLTTSVLTISVLTTSISVFT